MGWYTTGKEAQMDRIARAIVITWLHRQGHWIINRSGGQLTARGPLGEREWLSSLHLTERAFLCDVHFKSRPDEEDGVLRHGFDLDEWNAWIQLPCNRYRMAMVIIEKTPHKSVRDRAKETDQWPQPRLLTALYDNLQRVQCYIDLEAHSFAAGKISWDVADFADHGQLDTIARVQPKTPLTLPPPGVDRYADWHSGLLYPRVPIRKRPSTQLNLGL